MVTDHSDWPLPSQSRRVRLLLYLAESMILGAGLTLVLLQFFGAFFIDIETGSFTLDFSVFDAFLLFFLLYFLVRGIAIVKEGRRWSQDNPPEYRDWKETRRWLWVTALALSIGGLLLGMAVRLWGWWEVVFLQDTNLLLLGTILVGFVLYLYVLHRIGATIS